MAPVNLGCQCLNVKHLLFAFYYPYPLVWAELYIWCTNVNKKMDH